MNSNIGMIIIVNAQVLGDSSSEERTLTSVRTALPLYFNLDKKYLMIISTLCSRYCENAQFLNRSTGTYIPEFMVL